MVYRYSAKSQKLKGIYMQIGDYFYEVAREWKVAP